MDLIILLVILVIFAAPMFLMQRKQKKQMEQLRSMQGQLLPGDHVVTTAGLHALVHLVDEDEVDLEIAPGVITRWEKIAIVKKIEDSPEAANNAFIESPKTETEAAGGATEHTDGYERPQSFGSDADRPDDGDAR